MISKRSTRTAEISMNLIAPCGMNCRLCSAFIRERRQCPGCRGDDSNKPKSCAACKIKNCEKMVWSGARYCFSCDSFPCDRLKHLDKRYRTRYGMSMIDNLMNIQKSGIRQFVRNEKERWKCPKCGEILSVHKPQCLYCQHKWR